VAEVMLRFYGRFLWTDVPGGGYLAMAPRYDGGQLGAEHQPTMTIRHRDVQFSPRDSEPTTFDPVRRTVSLDAIATVATEAELVSPETLMWDLAGRSVSFGMSERVTLTEDPPAKLLLLRDLAGASAPVADAARRGAAQGPSTFTVAISAGQVRARSLLSGADGEVKFATVAQTVNTPEGQDVLLTNAAVRHPADLVEVRVTLPAGQKTLKLTFAPEAEGSKEDEPKVVTVKDGAVIAFTNVCAPLQKVHMVDLEFARYYMLLDAPPSGNELIPAIEPEPGGLGEGMGCMNMARD
jgi:hypothetical protein